MSWLRRRRSSNSEEVTVPWKERRLLTSIQFTKIVNSTMYIYDLPHKERKELCHILDQHKWEELAEKHMQYGVSTIQELRREKFKGCSPTDKLLTMWGLLNHTVLELFFLLSRIHHYQAMTVIKKCVPVAYHILIKKEEQNPLERLKLQDTNVTLNGNAEIVNVAIPHISYKELENSTNGWDESAIMGKGGFGTVYKGFWKCTLVAIKRIEKRDDPKSHNKHIKQSITELYCLNAYRHDNILPLYAFSMEGPQPCLVYQHMPGGCLEKRLRTNEQINWQTRLNIAIGSARGLQYIHTVGPKPLVHGDIKPSNILLDVNDNARIGDFGLAREGPDRHNKYIKLSRVCGTRPYLPDEFLRAGKFSTKVDIYSFGIVLLEMATGMRAYSDRKMLRDRILEHNGDIRIFIDKRVENGDEVFGKLMRIGKWCVQQIPRNRPEMVEVLLQLEGTVCC